MPLNTIYLKTTRIRKVGICGIWMYFQYLQCSGGPIGARLTMAIARLVMQDWWDIFSHVLKISKLKERLRAIYVDDGRIIVEKLKKGVKYDKVEKKFVFKKEWEEQDTVSGESSESRTVEQMKLAMCDVSEDLQFTMETETDFDTKRLPTLSFEMWSEKTGIRHSYFEKGMRSQILTMKRSSQSENSKYSILVNELNRRFEVMDKDISINEKVSVIDHYCQQLINSGYRIEQIR